VTQDWYNWRQSAQVDKIQVQDVKTELLSGKAYWRGKDKRGYPIVVIRPRWETFDCLLFRKSKPNYCFARFHFPKKSNFEEFVKAAVWQVVISCA